MKTDKRPDPKPRKYSQLWQSYLWWDEVMEMRKRHLLRVSSIQKGKSNLDERFEHDWMEHMQIDALLCELKKTMVNYGRMVGPVWTWASSIKGLGAGGLLAQLFAQIDDIGKFDTVSKLWAFSGWAVKDGERQRCKKGEKAPYNRRLKSICYLIGDQFIKQTTPLYYDLYCEEKERLRGLYPEPVEAPDSPWPTNYTDSHIHRMALRKMVKIFLQHLWVVWRSTEGLPISKPWVHEHGGHTHIIPPPNLDILEAS